MMTASLRAGNHGQNTGLVGLQLHGSGQGVDPLSFFKSRDGLMAVLRAQERKRSVILKNFAFARELQKDSLRPAGRVKAKIHNVTIKSTLHNSTQRASYLREKINVNA